MPGDHQVLAGPGAGDEEHAPFTLDVEAVRALVVGGRGDGGRRWYVALADADRSDTAELQPLHPVHGRDRNLTVSRRTLGKRDSRNSRRGERGHCLVDEHNGPGRDPDLSRLYVAVQPALHDGYEVLHLGRPGGRTMQGGRRVVDLGAAPRQGIQVLVVDREEDDPMHRAGSR